MLSIRFEAWPSIIESQNAANWARYWRPEIQGYIYAYRAATGMDLTERPDATAPGPAPPAAHAAGHPGQEVGGRAARPAASGPGADSQPAPRSHRAVTWAEAIDFTSASYLGLRHPAGRAQAVAPADHRCARGACRATLGHCYSQVPGGAWSTEHAVLTSSTLHAFWDLFVTLGADQLACYVDSGTYPIAGWGVERAAARGALAGRFPHRDVTALARLLGSRRAAGRMPVVVTDGLCPGCGTAAPLRPYLRALRPLGGLLVVDDTQALGIFGQDAAQHPPYGLGGGGSLRLARLSSPDVLIVSSLAKAFGVPVGDIAGRASLVERYEQRSETRVHCSPPSLAHSGGRHALDVNLRQGESGGRGSRRLSRGCRQGVRDLGLRSGPPSFLCKP